MDVWSPQDADSVDIYQLSRNWADLVKRARSKQVRNGATCALTACLPPLNSWPDVLTGIST